MDDNVGSDCYSPELLLISHKINISLKFQPPDMRGYIADISSPGVTLTRPRTAGGGRAELEPTGPVHDRPSPSPLDLSDCASNDKREKQLVPEIYKNEDKQVVDVGSLITFVF